MEVESPPKGVGRLERTLHPTPPPAAAARVSRCSGPRAMSAWRESSVVVVVIVIIIIIIINDSIINRCRACSAPPYSGVQWCTCLVVNINNNNNN